MSDEEDDDKVKPRPPTPREHSLARAVLLAFAFGLAWMVGRGLFHLCTGHFYDIRPLNGVCMLLAWAFLCIAVPFACTVVILWLYWAATTEPSKPEGFDEDDWR